MNPYQILLTRHDLAPAHKAKPIEEIDQRHVSAKRLSFKQTCQANVIVFVDDDGQTKVLKNGHPSGLQPK